MTTMTFSDRPVLSSGRPIEEREAELAEGAEGLAGGRPSRLEDGRTLLTVSGAAMTLGLSAILLGWFGAARSTLVEEQVPYLISGGLLGVALATIGALVFFSHWLTVAVKEARQHEAARRHDHAELIAALHAIARHDGEEVTDGRARGPRRERPLRPAPRGS
jgi:hypothetical protein